AISAPGSDYAGTIACNPVTGQIAYYDDDSIFVVPAEGGTPRLVSAGLSFAWSPDGRTLAFADEGFNNGTFASGDVFTTTDLGATKTNLTNSTNLSEAYPVWS